MVFRRRGGFSASIRPVNRIKHVVDRQGGLIGGTQTILDLADTKDAPTLANTEQVETGSTINGIYIKVEGYATGTSTLANMYFAIVKNPGGNLTFPNANAVGGSDNKKYVIHQEMVMLEKNSTGNPRTLFAGVIGVPRGYRRNGPADKLQILLFSPGVTTDFCLQCIYKEFR